MHTDTQVDEDGLIVSEFKAKQVYAYVTEVAEPPKLSFGYYKKLRGTRLDYCYTPIS